MGIILNSRLVSPETRMDISMEKSFRRRLLDDIELDCIWIFTVGEEGITIGSKWNKVDQVYILVFTI